MASACVQGTAAPGYPRAHARDLTPGDYDAPVFSLGGQDDYAFSPDGKEICYASNHDKNPAASTNNDLWIVPVNGATGASPVQVLAQDQEHHRRQSRQRHLPALFPRRPLHRLPRPAASRIRERPLPPHALRPQDRREEEADGESRFLGWDVRVVTGFQANLFRASSGKSESPIISFAIDRALLIRQSLWMATPRKPPNVTLPWWCVMAFNDDTSHHARRKNDRLHANVDFVPNRRSTRPLPREASAEQLARQPDGSDSHQRCRSIDGRHVAPRILLVHRRRQRQSPRLPHQAPGLRPRKKYPVKFLIHGGPQGAWGDAWCYRWNAELFAANGYVVVMINPAARPATGRPSSTASTATGAASPSPT